MLLQSILLAAGVAGVFGAATGVALMLIPRRMLDRGSPLRRLLLEAHVGEPFNRRFTIERSVYRRHRIFAVVVMAGALAVMSLLWISMRHSWAPASVEAFLGTPGFRAVMAVTAALALFLVVVGVCLWVRPSVLKGIEAVANRWIDPMPNQGSSAMIGDLVSRTPRLAGALLLVSGLACLRLF